MKIAERPELFDRSRSFKTWIFSAASNVCKNYYRHKKLVEEKEPEIVASLQNEAHSFSVPAKFDHTIFSKTLDKVLEQLSIEKREAFVLKYLEDKTIAEIAEIQSCPEGSVKSRLYYTMRILEEKLKIFNPSTE